MIYQRIELIAVSGIMIFTIELLIAGSLQVVLSDAEIEELVAEFLEVESKVLLSFLIFLQNCLLSNCFLFPFSIIILVFRQQKRKSLLRRSH